MTAAHAQAVLAIFAQGIATGDATLDPTAPDWPTFDARHAPDCRLVAVADGRVVGWTALVPYSTRQVYRGVAWESVYVAEDARGRGVGLVLLNALREATNEAGYWTILAGVELENAASLALHRRAGFRRVGVHRRLGQDPQGRWRDVVILERRTPRLAEREVAST